MLDSNEKDRLYEAQIEIEQLLLEDALENVPFLIFANKQDLPMSLSVAVNLVVGNLRSEGNYRET